MKKVVIFIVVLTLTLALLTVRPTPARAHWGWFWPGFVAGLGTAAIVNPYFYSPYYYYPPYYPYYGYYGGYYEPWYGVTMVAILGLGMGTMTATIGDIMAGTMGVDIMAATMVDIGDSWFKLKAYSILF